MTLEKHSAWREAGRQVKHWSLRHQIESQLFLDPGYLRERSVSMEYSTAVLSSAVATSHVYLLGTRSVVGATQELDF